MESDIGTLAWCHIQAENIMSISAELAKGFNDPLGHINSIASDIAINLEMLAERLAKTEKEN